MSLLKINENQMIQREIKEAMLKRLNYLLLKTYWQHSNNIVLIYTREAMGITH